ncbi:MAG: TiaS agmantine-binding domain-containing protein [Candidatus Thorarchaeota archaeon]|jgi:tRNA(Ile2)-agmatinylcytidine synthase
MSVTSIHVGMDDIDSPEGGCTTHFASLVVERLSSLEVDWSDYPNLIRLNPNIPYRTRGNGAVAIRLSIDATEVDGILPLVESMVKEYVEASYPNTNPGVVLVRNDVPTAVVSFATRALWRAIPVSIADKLLEKHSIAHIRGGNGRGLVGALAAVGNRLENDHTYELIAYRAAELTSEPRGVDEQSVIEMDRRMGNRLFSNVDPVTKRALIVPRGPDPVLFGIRGERVEDVLEASSHVKSDQSVDRAMAFRTNQGTGAHLVHCVYVSDLRPYMAAVVHGVVDRKPKMTEGGHVVFSVGDCSGRIDSATYEPTGEFRKVVLQLVKGDQVLVHAAVRPASRTHGLTLNVEGLEIVNLAQVYSASNPVCPHCLKRMKSAGKGQGYKCFSCGFKDPEGTKTEIPVERTLEEEVYLPPPRAQRHLTRPLARIGRENKGIPDELVDNWQRF